MTLTITTSAGPVAVDTTEPVPGLRVFEIPSDVSPLSSYRYVLAHHEGRALAAFTSADAAREAAEAVASLADWTRTVMTTANEISLGGNTERLAELLTEHGGQHPNT